MKRLGILVVILALGCGEDAAPNAQTLPNNASNNVSNNASSNNESNNSTSNMSNNSSSNNTSNNDTTTNNTTSNNTTCVGLDPGIGECDPLCQTGCGSKLACIARQDPEQFKAMCQGAGILGQDEPCVKDANCVPGAMCHGFNGEDSTCRLYCRPADSAAPQCPNGYRCRAFQGEPRLGVCDLPANECTQFPNSCEVGQECYDTANGTRCSRFDTMAVLGKVCTQSTECNDRHRCAGSSPTTLTCKPICNPQEITNTCLNGTTCIQMKDAVGNDFAWGACM